MPEQPNVARNLVIEMLWSVVSKAADRSSSDKMDTRPRPDLGRLPHDEGRSQDRCFFFFFSSSSPSSSHFSFVCFFSSSYFVVVVVVFWLLLMLPLHLLMFFSVFSLFLIVILSGCLFVCLLFVCLLACF